MTAQSQRKEFMRLCWKPTKLPQTAPPSPTTKKKVCRQVPPVQICVADLRCRCRAITTPPNLPVAEKVYQQAAATKMCREALSQPTCENCGVNLPCRSKQCRLALPPCAKCVAKPSRRTKIPCCHAKSAPASATTARKVRREVSPILEKCAAEHTHGRALWRTPGPPMINEIKVLNKIKTR